jgi:hypothetical protein
VVSDQVLTESEEDKCIVDSELKIEDSPKRSSKQCQREDPLAIGLKPNCEGFITIEK